MIRIRSHKTRPEGKRNRSTPHWLHYFQRIRPVCWVACPVAEHSTTQLWSPVEGHRYAHQASFGSHRLWSLLSDQMPLILVLLSALFLMPQIMPAPNITDLIVDSTSDPNNVILKVGVENNNVGSTYNSGLSNHFSLLDDSLYSLIPQNQIDYTDSADLVANWGGISILAPPGEVKNGWNGNFNTDGSLDLTSAGKSADSWTQTNSNSDYMFFEKAISKNLLEFDGIAGYNPATDASIVLSGESNTMSDAFVGTQNIDNVFSASGQYFQVQVPEVSASALVMGGLAALVLCLRRRCLLRIKWAG